MRSYRSAGLGQSADADVHLVRDLQSDLRALGYLRRGIDGQFGNQTRLAVRRLQFDLLNNDGRSNAADGNAPVAIKTFNKGVSGVTGIVDPALADSIEALLADASVPKLPESNDPKPANAAALAAISRMASTVAPTPFILAIFKQESGGCHYAVPSGASDSDSFIVVGLDANAASTDQVTSRGYGIGQYTLFHHPPRTEEVADVMTNPLRNATQAYATLRDKFDRFLVGATSDTQADDRKAEHPLLQLRPCRYAPGDSRYMRACKDCAAAVGKVDISKSTPLFHESAQTYGEASGYSDPSYSGVPDRAQFLCDWPYAIRRYNGKGPNSFNYQAIVLLNLLAGTAL